jgi:hypothetical protein
MTSEEIIVGTRPASPMSAWQSGSRWRRQIRSTTAPALSAGTDDFE